MASEQEPVWLDCDPGHDDFMAIVLAAHNPRLRLLGISTSAGNQTILRTTTNALNCLNVCGKGKEIPVVAGQAHPLMCSTITVCPEIHGESGLETIGGNSKQTFPSHTLSPLKEKAPIAMSRIICASAQKVTLIATGPLTNVALLLSLCPEVTHHLKQIVIMGGAMRGGNTHPVAEFNIQTDPEAAKIVFDQSLPPRTHPLSCSLASSISCSSCSSSSCSCHSSSSLSVSLANTNEIKETETKTKTEKQTEKQQKQTPTSSTKKTTTTQSSSSSSSIPDYAITAVPVPVYMVPVEVTHTAIVTEKVLNRIASLSYQPSFSSSSSSSLSSSSVSASASSSSSTTTKTEKQTSTQSISLSPSPYAALLRDLLEFFSKTYKEVFGFTEGPPLHDPCAVAYVIDPFLFQGRWMRVEVEVASPLCRGQTVCDIWDQMVSATRPKNVFVCEKMNVSAFWDLLLAALSKANAISCMNY
eukprot:TRINITY_DN204_c2_g2_i1.p1 TRINITY_DN204_c2_g2~~TRINITY_DN204_c2_g2_i1.p1  ORF type:complete len:471 (+),score=155.19 TRINITY_DN204_c2_g2_i1:30-1442(+)